MKKIMTALGVIALPLAIALTITSCQKQIISKNQQEEIATSSAASGPVTRAYRDSFDADLQFVPDIAGGWTYPNAAPAWWPGSGQGNATHMGKVNIYFNSHTLYSAGVVTVYHSPVINFFASQLLFLNVPPDASGVIYDDKGNSIWMKIAPEGLPSWRIDATHIGMAGKMLIIGGTGKFAGATGETQFHAAFNQLNLQECSIWQNGWVSY